MHKNKLIRITLISAIIILMLLISVLGYLKYRQYASFKQGIHKNAALIFRINADQIYSKLFKDYLCNSGYYKDRNKYSNLNTGLKIPANVFIYNISCRSFDTFFCLMPIKNPENLKFFLKDKLRINTTGQEAGLNFATSSDNKITVAYNNQRIAIAYSFKKEAVAQILKDMLKGENMLQFDDERLSKLKANKADVAYAYGQYEGIGNFNDGKITFNGDFSSRYLKPNQGSLSHKKFSRSAQLTMWLNIDLSRLPVKKIIQLKRAELNIDSLLKYKVRYADLEVAGKIEQQDTVITYDYNDDFEKVATAGTKTSFVPNVLLSLNSDAAPLTKYLNREHVISYNGIFNKTLFPLYNIYWFAGTDEFKLSTSKYVVSSMEREETTYFFGLEVDFSSFSAKGSSQLNLKKIGDLKLLTIFARQKNNDVNCFEAVLKFKKSDINGLAQLF